MRDNWEEWDKLKEFQKFEIAYRSMIHREGADQLLDALSSNGFFIAPASTHHHGSYMCGLVEHSNDVFRRLIKLAADRTRGKRQYSVETLAIVSLLHDVCKSNSYILRDNGYFYNDLDDLPMGHGEKSVYMIMKYMDLTDEEALAIRWHMGAYDKAAIADSRDLNRAMKRSDLVTMLHLADMQATYLI